MRVENVRTAGGKVCGSVPGAARKGGETCGHDPERAGEAVDKSETGTGTVDNTAPQVAAVDKPVEDPEAAVHKLWKRPGRKLRVQPFVHRGVIDVLNRDEQGEKTCEKGLSRNRSINRVS